jgi:hypothetical protein
MDFQVVGILVALGGQAERVREERKKKLFRERIITPKLRH